MTTMQLEEQTIWDALREVLDPELPAINVVDLGVIRCVQLGEPIVIELMPTFVGCPAIEMMKRDIARRLAEFGPVEVHVVYDEPWTSGRISEAGRRMLHSAGFAPPPPPGGDIRLIPIAADPVACPYCGS
ncbi:MAG TPA: iron-sulfur cluster assembly protein, partial [Thermomicrobiaceae bacterium]|nr:iron-sulfur cluster assembly protein [Thermomicrobiaceae bacterium]